MSLEESGTNLKIETLLDSNYFVWKQKFSLDLEPKDLVKWIINEQPNGENAFYEN